MEDEIVSIEQIENAPAFDLHVEDNHNFYLANGVLSANSGTGKGEAQKALMDLVRYVNIRVFMSRYGITDIADLWKAYEKYAQDSQAFAHSRKDATQRVISSVEDNDEEDEGEEKAKASIVAASAPVDLKPVAKKPKIFKMTESQKRDFQAQIKGEEGKYWNFFTSNTANFLPINVQSNRSTTAKLTGGNDDVPKNGSIARIWKPGILESHAFFAWDEAKAILFAKDQEGAQQNTQLLSALDDPGKVSSSARKNVDEFGNDKDFYTTISLITGTTEVEGLDQTLASNGLLQRFVIGYRKFTPDESLALRLEVNDSNAKPSDISDCLKEYYDELISHPVYRGNIEFSGEAIRFNGLKISEDDAYLRRMFMTGTAAYKIANTFLNRRTKFVKKAAAILASLDNVSVVSVEHMKKAHELIGDEMLHAIASVVDECSTSIPTGSEAKNMVCHQVLLEILGKYRNFGKNYFKHTDLVEEAMKQMPKWPHRGIDTSDMAVRRWSENYSSFVERVTIDGALHYRLRTNTVEGEMRKRRDIEETTKRLMGAQGKTVEDLKRGWDDLSSALKQDAPEAAPIQTEESEDAEDSASVVRKVDEMTRKRTVEKNGSGT